MTFDCSSNWVLAIAANAPQVATNPSAFHKWITSPIVAAPAPIPVFVLLAPVLWLLFRNTWRELDTQAQRERGRLLAIDKWDARPAVACVIMAVVLTLHEYYGGGRTYQSDIMPLLKEWENGWLYKYINLRKYNNLYSYGWWSFTRLLGYVVIPLTAWKIIFRKDSILDMGFRIKGFIRHAWIYLVSLCIVIPAVLIVAQQPDFGTYYPFYKQSSRSWLDLGCWEVMYFAQFLGLEIFFRGWFLGALRKTLGSGAIFAMIMPYCMIHFGKPYLEAHGAIVAGIFLGSLAMKTKSIYAGFLVHITVALTMDMVALHNSNALPTQLFAP